ncbi:class I SAM-dependent methyltransferase [Desertifilum sp. FACHB-1129]|uniref:Methyltransferase type 11 n=2 Tax=Desertifilum tharense IPPAS B-1220 TaxID=1781255 RepID=A0A1E5QQ00_9CYAN|nr:MULTISPECIES: class I SAM-dependent methyltransferase [Desertifilum]MDA0209672.1 class I SAM-dependent methyltransferase [Cyanobacteria bacterium FC1]MBD2310836.1 class I SAM-dependent methyltransferase [Desertifilum sp. FACHB-1129]MBD2320873.1 class I SAM-dependent methyltransferase [Desertifilum sp. FACHB-866]MBD2331001.1 class I SAM-dependent methyltransferase [Desertifilum sp. FACHB-868]OEJ76691.1 methyltransferase type 11 [Desertifilum tharense IPPAS B-1220]
MSSINRYTDYDPWAWLYNQSEAQLAYQRFMPCLEKVLFPAIPKSAKILDLCCGTGQLSHQLTQRGYQVTGLDGSEKMLHYARENAPQVNFVLEDARNFHFETQFDAVLSTDSGLNHILSLEELQQVFQNVFNALKPNGLFLFDLGLEKRYRNIPVNDGELKEDYAWMVGETYDPLQKTGTFTITMFQPKNSSSSVQNHLQLQQIKRSIFNAVLRYLKPSILLNWVEKDWQRSDLTFSVKPYTQQEVRAALEAVGFTQVQVYKPTGKLSKSPEKRYAYFMACKSSQSEKSQSQTEAKEASVSYREPKQA